MNIQNSTLYSNFKELLKLVHYFEHCSSTSASDLDNRIYQPPIKNINALLSNYQMSLPPVERLLKLLEITKKISHLDLMTLLLSRNRLFSFQSH